MKRTWTIKIFMAIVTCAALSLTACSSADTPAPASTLRSGSAAASAPTTSAGGATIVSATALCEYLRERLPTLRKIGSEVGAMGNLAGNLYSWYEKQGAVPIGSEMDEQTQQACLMNPFQDIPAKPLRTEITRVGALLP